MHQAALVVSWSAAGDALTLDGLELSPMPTTRIRIQGQDYEITGDDIIGVARGNEPGSINTYYVEVEGRKYPSKQVIRAATGTAEPFDWAGARSALTKLGFIVKAI